MNYIVKDDEPQDGVFPEKLKTKVDSEMNRILDIRQNSKELSAGLSKLGCVFMSGYLANIVTRAINEGRKNVSIDELLRCFEDTREFSNKFPD
ncbi:hypothetical protein M7775_07750 [Sporomusa sphaeroides DSM 2875]|uniref:hypothetical protein n=1 Tax=Sporomusa sphaeroides TaxID=47679 RepID=UPI0020300AD1|nr:hypothetical protein [Sporomusa sphaeroides]MCM0758466.1 hypothetical protein [Sporomusa sphaeroides DSM 2875]